ncbi:BRCA1-A complex subunit Abraxas 1 isoform X1 [Antennarius striatus]|uniref:BRCA1-A complex subunit Abraxas 1 isoform X1 n=1 Tax=Antennarius striatus TaxID=241820 RepID=UPI0035B20362
MAEPTVRMSGIVLASLMFQHVNSSSDVEGLILGESKFEEQITISDSQTDHIHIEEIYHVQKHIGCHKLNDFYSSVGDVNMDAVQKILADNKQENVIGWYRQRRNTEQQMTFREKLIHEKLKSALSNPHMIFMLLTTSKLTPPGSTHRMEYAAFVSRSRRFVNIPVLVNNLGLLDQLSYWKVSAPCSAVGFNLTMKKHRWDVTGRTSISSHHYLHPLHSRCRTPHSSSRFFSSNGGLREVSEVNDMNESLQTELQKACRDVEESERLVESLQAEVSSLRKKLSEKKRSEAPPDGEPPEEKNNLLLHQAVRTLFSCSPLFHTQTLTLDGFPVANGCCSSEQEVSAAIHAQENRMSPPHPSRTNPRKRQRDVQPRRQKKRRKS